MEPWEKIPDDEWEKLCLKCGQCCHHKMQFKYIFIVDPVETCEHLAADKTCSVYKDRFANHKTCIPIKEALKKPEMLLPRSCPYTKFIKDYKGFTMTDEETFDAIMTVFMVIEVEELRLGRDLNEDEIQNILSIGMDEVKDLIKK